MGERTLVWAIREQTARMLWEIANVTACVPQEDWNAPYGGMPVWKHVYHTLHSLDHWFQNPYDPAYREPPFHTPGLNDLDTPAGEPISRETLTDYLKQVEKRTLDYLDGLDDDALRERPEGCPFSRMTLVLGQHRHLSTHMGMLMGYLVIRAGRWPRVLGLEGQERQGPSGLFD